MISNSDESGGCESGKGGEARCGGRMDCVGVVKQTITADRQHGCCNFFVFRLPKSRERRILNLRARRSFRTSLQHVPPIK